MRRRLGIGVGQRNEPLISLAGDSLHSVTTVPANENGVTVWRVMKAFEQGILLRVPNFKFGNT